MKKITFLIILAGLMASFCHTFAQNNTIDWTKYISNPNGYNKNPNMNKFAGTWQWQSGDTVFTIVLEKYIFKSNAKTGFLKGASFDAIYGWHEYKIGDKVIESSLQHVGDPLEKRTYTIQTGGSKDVDMVSNLFFIDLSKPKNGVASLKLIPGEKDLARWTLKGSPGVKVLLPGEEPDYTFTVPTDVIMRKINKKKKNK